MREANARNWLDTLKDEFEHPAIVLWRAVELRHIDRFLKRGLLEEPLLDLGCAEGKIAGVLFRNRRLYGLDNCWELLNKNCQRDSIYKALILADARKLPYKNEVFGSIFSNCVVEHIYDIESVLSEVFRVLRTQGIFLFTVPSHRFSDLLFFSVIFEKLKLRSLAKWYKTKRNRGLSHFHCYDHNHWRNILRKNGLSLVEYEYYMTKKATFIWDFLAASVFILRYAWPLNYLLPKINKWLTNYLKIYYNMDSSVGSALLLVAKKGEK